MFVADADIEDIRPIFEKLQLAAEDDDDEGDNDTEWCFPVTPDTHTSNADMNPKAHYLFFGIDDKDYGKTECSDEFGNPCADVLVCSSIAKCFLDDRAL